MLLVAAGAAYTFLMGHQASNTPVHTTADVAPVEPAIKPSKPAPNAPESAAVESLTSPVAPGANASVAIKTNPGSKCTIAVVYNNVASTDSGLVAKIADDYGDVSWSWTVGPDVPLGTWPVKVTCAYNTRSAFVQGDLTVQK